MSSEKLKLFFDLKLFLLDLFLFYFLNNLEAAIDADSAQKQSEINVLHSVGTVRSISSCKKARRRRKIFKI